MTRRAGDAEEASGVVVGDVLDPQGKMLLTRDAILAFEDVQYEYVDVPEWGGGRIRVRSLTGSDRDAYDAESWAQGQKSPSDTAAPLRDFRIRRVARAIVDEDGAPVFSPADVKALGEKNARAIDRIDDVVARLSGLDNEQVRMALDALKGVPSGGSGSA